MNSGLLVPLALFSFASLALGQGHVLVVDAAGGGAYTQIGTALGHAAAGDVLLVKSGNYPAFAVANQSVSIVGDANALVQVNGTVQVRQLIAGRSVLLHRLQAFGVATISANDGPGITIKNDTGPVRVQECLAQGAAGRPGVRIEGSGDVALATTQAFGATAWSLSGAGVLANGTAAAIYDCDLHGAVGAAPLSSWSPPECYGGSGGSAVRSTSDGFLYVAGSQLVGGNGYDGANNCFPTGTADCCYGGNGGSGIDVLAGIQTLWQLGNSFQLGVPGGGGYGQCGCGLLVWCQCDPGNSGNSVAAWYGDTIVNLAGGSPSLGLSSNPARELTTVGITIDSAPGDRVLLVACGATAFAPEMNRGVRLVDWNGPHHTQRLGTTDAQGHLLANLPIPDLGPGVESQILHLQALVVHANGSRVWSNPLALVLLDSAF